MILREPGGVEMRVRAWPVVFLVGVMILESPAAAPETVAGRSLAEWTAELASTSRTRRLRAALTLPSFGTVAVKPLAKALEHDDPGVIYWAASGLGDLAHKPTRTRSNYERLRGLLKHKSIGLRLSAAYALSRIGETGSGVGVLAKGLEHPHRGVACAAADFLARIGPPAANAVPALIVAARHKDYHVKGAANEALKRIRAVKGGK